jgi:acyl-coenzyme A thioesterase PaaI-like protein
MTFLFDRETALIPCGNGQYTIEASDVYRNPTGVAFGGWVAAIMARAIENHPDRTSPIVSLQATYIAGIGPGEVRVESKLLKSGASTQFWRVELYQAENLAIVGDIVTSNRRPVDLNYQIAMPEISPPEDYPRLEPVPGQAPEWIRTYDQYIAKGVPFQVNDTPETIVWIKEEDGRPIDRISIISICDVPMPRTFFLSDEFHPGSTVAMSTYIYASAEDIAAAGSDYMIMRVTGAVVRNSKSDSRVELWSGNGTLLATSNQIGFFR